MIEFLLWFTVLFVLYQTKAAWWVWAIFILGSLVAFLGTGYSPLSLKVAKTHR